MTHMLRFSPRSDDDDAKPTPNETPTPTSNARTIAPMPVGVMAAGATGPLACHYHAKPIAAPAGAMPLLTVRAGVPAFAVQHAVAHVPLARAMVLPGPGLPMARKAVSIASEGTQCGLESVDSHMRAAKEALAMTWAAASFDKWTSARRGNVRHGSELVHAVLL